ncbi:MAG: tryptophan synthase subunit alpha, partial [Bacteroidetes bacterium]|nr:tryptophan synthase subunit alpha [Bacteroidota bacterium]
DYKTSLKIVKIFAKRGNVIELGIPFSDPIADGSTIQKADVRALKYGFNTNKIFDFLKKVRKFTDKPIGLLVYYNLIYQYGLDRFCSKAKESGVDSIVVADLSLEESYDFIKTARKNNIATVFLVTQLTNTKRLRKILKK